MPGWTGVRCCLSGQNRNGRYRDPRAVGADLRAAHGWSCRGWTDVGLAPTARTPLAARLQALRPVPRQSVPELVQQQVRLRRAFHSALRLQAALQARAPAGERVRSEPLRLRLGARDLQRALRPARWRGLPVLPSTECAPGHRTASRSMIALPLAAEARPPAALPRRVQQQVLELQRRVHRRDPAFGSFSFRPQPSCCAHG